MCLGASGARQKMQERIAHLERGLQGALGGGERVADESGEAQKTVLGKSQSVGKPAELTGHKKGSLAHGGIRDCTQTTAQSPK